jgi:hypothetical protein
MSQQLQGVILTETYSSTRLTELGLVVGSIYTDKNSYRYKLYKFNNGVGNVASVAGNFAYIYAVSGASAGETTEVTMDLTDCAGVGAGVFQAVIADGEYGWLQISGIATLTTALTAGADGNALTPVGAGADGTLDVTDAVTSHVCAIAIDATAKIVSLIGMG